MLALLPVPTARAAPGDLPHIWRAHTLARSAAPGLPTGHAALDAQLPGGGWPVAGLVELLQPPAGQHDFQLLLPALAELTRQHSGPLVLVGAPPAPAASCGLMPFGPALAAQGLLPQRLLWVHADAPAAQLWACEQALRCADVLAVLAWLPRCTPEALRRLHVGAMEHGKPLWVVRPESARHASSAAPLRLLLRGVNQGMQQEQMPGDDVLQVQVLKRRGPPLAQPVLLPARSKRLAAQLASRRRPVQESGASPLPAQAVEGVGERARARAEEGAHALGRLVAA